MGLVVLIEILNGNPLFAGVPESLALLAFGMGLFGATAAARRFFKRHDEARENDKE